MTVRRFGAAGSIRQACPRSTYLSLRIETTLLEVSAGLPERMSPCTLCVYDVDCEPVVDLRTAKDWQDAGIDSQDMACAWLMLALAGKEPPTWRLARRLIGAGAAGVLVPSFATGAAADDQNLVLWRWGADLPHRVVVYDPEGRLPSDQSSWP